MAKSGLVEATVNIDKNVDKYPKKTRVENFTPPYLDPAVDGFPINQRQVVMYVTNQ